MLNSIRKRDVLAHKEEKFSILIPTWNNLPYLQLCIESIRKNSFYFHQIIVIINEGEDGSREWVDAQNDLSYVDSPENIGICYALNACRTLIRTDYVAYSNDDMYFLPNWDKALFAEIESIGHKSFMLSATMIEPSGNNISTVSANYGDDVLNFKEQELLKNYKEHFRDDWNGSMWPPSIMHIDCWDLVGGMSIEFSPGMYSDPDLARKLWQIGVRTFKGKGNSLVYHFGCKSTGRVKKNKGYKTFTLKWGLSSRTFTKDFLRIGSPALEKLPEVKMSKKEKANQFLKRLKSIF